MNSFYVYEWIRLDTNEPFYIGKGINERCFALNRNKHFNDVIKYCNNNDIKYVVNILEDNLSEKEAFQYECWYIHHYMVEMGFNLTNKTWGGEGGNTFVLMSPEKKIEYRKNMRLKLLGKNTGKKDEEICKKISITKKSKGIGVGKNNPMYGKNVKDFMTPEAILKWRQNISKSGMGRIHSEETRKKMSKSSRQKVIAKLGDNIIEFESVAKCKEYFKNKYDLGFKTTQNIINSNKPYKTKKLKYKELNNIIINKIN